MPIYYGWVIVAIGFLLEMLVMGTALYSYSVFVLPLSREFGVGVFAAMLGLTGLNAAVALLSPAAGLLISRGSVRRYMIGGLFVIGSGFLLLAHATALWQVIAIYALLIGFGYALVAPIAVSAVITQWFIGLRGRALSAAAIGTSFGGLLFPPCAALIIGYADWRLACSVFGLLYFCLAIPMVWALVVNRPADKNLQPYGADNSAAGAADAESEHTAPAARVLLRNADFWLIALAIGASFSVFMGFTANIVPYAKTLGYTEQQGALFLSGLTSCAMAGKIVFAAVTDRLGLRNTFWIAVGLDLVGVGLLIVFPNYMTLFAAAACVGLSSGGLLPSWPRFVAARFGRNAIAKGMGLMAPVVNGGMMILPPFAGLVFDIYGDYKSAFTLFFILLLLALYATRRLDPAVPTAATGLSPAQLGDKTVR